MPCISPPFATGPRHIGFYDTVYLPLDEGENELVIAVSESFGGWGVQARLMLGEAHAGAPPNVEFG